MAETINRRCPRCGRKAHDRLLVQCPDCQVPFVLDEGPRAELTPELLRLLAAQVFGSWKFWAAVLVLVGVAAWGVVIVADRMIEARSQAYLNTLGQQATNRLGAAFGQISNQILLEFKQPKIRAAIDQVARQRAGEIFTNSLRPSLDAFQEALDETSAQLIRSSNIVAELEAAALAAKNRIPPPVPVAAVSELPVQIAPVAKPAASPATNADGAVKLVLANRNVVQAGNTYLLTLFFKVSGSPTKGTVDMMAGTYKQTARILNFSAPYAGPIGPPTLNATGDAAELKFTVSDQQPPNVIMEVSAPTIVRIVSDSLDGDLTIPIAADKMQLPPETK